MMRISKESYSFLQCDRPPFTHERLKLGGNSIRLITLKPNKNEYDFLECRIDQYAIHKRPPYIALSYTWGDDSEEYPIIINEKCFKIRRNLSDCLVQLRKHYNEEITLWIDALCIDQENIPERNHIVQLMDQVYERAETVYVWLGASDEGDDRAIPFLKQVATSLEFEETPVDAFLDRYMLPAKYYPDWLAVIRLFIRPYWTRLWIIQETLLAPDIEIYCGKQRILWKHIENVVRWVEYSYNHYDKRRPNSSDLHWSIKDSLAARMVLSRLNSNRFERKRDLYPSLQSLLGNFMTCVCYDERDKIFGLLSIASDFYTQRIDYIDYSLRRSQVFIKFLRYYLQKSADHHTDTTLLNISQLSDALQLSPLTEKISRLSRDRVTMNSYRDLIVNDKDLTLKLPCKVLANLVDETSDTDPFKTNCILRDFFNSFSSSNHSPANPVAKPPTFLLPDSSDELRKLRSLAEKRGSQICHAWEGSPDDPLSPAKFNTSEFRSFISSIDTRNTQLRPCFGLACAASEPGDILVKSKESDVFFVARKSEGGVYNVIGTALVHEDSSVRASVKSTLNKLWDKPLSFNRPHHQRSLSPVAIEPSLDDDPANDPDAVWVHFNPFMLLTIVNAPNWRKDRLPLPKNAHRQTTSYQAISTRGEDDPVLKSFGAKSFIGNPHVDRAANKILDKTVSKIEEIKGMAYTYDEKGTWSSD